MPSIRRSGSRNCCPFGYPCLSSYSSCSHRDSPFRFRVFEPTFKNLPRRQRPGIRVGGMTFPNECTSFCTIMNGQQTHFWSRLAGRVHWTFIKTAESCSSGKTQCVKTSIGAVLHKRLTDGLAQLSVERLDFDQVKAKADNADRKDFIGIGYDTVRYISDAVAHGLFVGTRNRGALIGSLIKSVCRQLIMAWPVVPVLDQIGVRNDQVAKLLVQGTSGIRTRRVSQFEIAPEINSTS